MNILSRLQIIKHTVEPVCKPSTSGVYAVGNPTEAFKLYRQFMISFFTDKSRDVKQITAIYKTLTVLIQNGWNEQHPQDQLLLTAKSSKSIR